MASLALWGRLSLIRSSPRADSAVASAAAGGCDGRGGRRTSLRREHRSDHIALPLDSLNRLFYGKQVLDLDHATAQIDVHLGVGVKGLNGLGDRSTQ